MVAIRYVVGPCPCWCLHRQTVFRGISNEKIHRRMVNMGNNVPNFDGMNREELSAWWKDHQRPTRTQAANVFPGRPRGYVRLVKDLANYACNKSVAMKCRADGKIQEAQMYEEICERIYTELPDFARW